ncbi:FAD-dependent oxidoreductase [Synechococcus sp. WH 8109]|uniref:NAD(P)/FAD-dependent oxidoreductase n=1 Tax=Synechococcus sp. WH 8109 TaxID=166314 RepID=UPI0006949EE1
MVIVGGGFAGVHACKALAMADVHITLIDKRNFNLFQRLLYQVATGLVSRSDVATTLRELVGKQDNVQLLLGEVTNVNREGKEIVFYGKAYSYDHLILTTGSGSTYFGHEDWRAFAPPMKILEHAEEIGRRLLMAMEQAEQKPNPLGTPVPSPTCMASNFRTPGPAAKGHRSPGLIPNRENRITLSIKWLYALATRQRASILLSGMPSKHLALDAEDAHVPMASGKGPSIAEPDAALKAAMDYYAHQLSGPPKLRSCSTPRGPQLRTRKLPSNRARPSGSARHS